jgi:hypothetical protein
VAPKAKGPVPIPTRVVVELVHFGTAAGALAMAAQERQASDRHQIRRLVVCAHAVVLSAICAAQVRGRIQPDRQSPIWCWLVD